MAVIKARIAGQWVEINGASPLVVQEEGVNLAPRAKLNLVGTRITATDDGANDRTTITVPNSLLSRVGTWSMAAQYTQGDVVKRYDAWWMTYTSPPVGNDPAGAVGQWEMIKGPALLTTALRTAFSGARNGDTVYDTDEDTLYVWTGAWVPSSPPPRVFSLDGIARGPASDGNTYAVTETGTLTQGGLTHVVGHIEFNFVNVNAATQVYIQVVRNRSGAIAIPAGGWIRAATAVNVSWYNVPINCYIAGTLPGDQIYVQMQRVTAGPGTWQTTSADYRINGVGVLEGIDYTT